MVFRWWVVVFKLLFLLPRERPCFLPEDDLFGELFFLCLLEFSTDFFDVLRGFGLLCLITFWWDLDKERRLGVVVYDSF